MFIAGLYEPVAYLDGIFVPEFTETYAEGS
jgi:hypothetical protein